MYGRGATDDNRLIERALSTIREFMEDDGQAFVYQKFIAPSTATVRFAKALDRSVIGSVTNWWSRRLTRWNPARSLRTTWASI